VLSKAATRPPKAGEVYTRAEKEKEMVWRDIKELGRTSKIHARDLEGSPEPQTHL